MQFTDIKNRVYFLTKTNSSSFPVADLVLSANNAVEHVVGLINRADQRWQFDDFNQTDLPIATATLTSGQQDYALSSAFLTVDRVEIKDTSANWHLLTPIDQQLLKRDRATAMAAYQPTNGTPLEYDVASTSVFLYPIPNYTQASSLKVYFTRGPVAFLTSDTSAQPGFPSIFHELIPLWVAYDYAIANALPTASGFMASIQLKEKGLADFYQLRQRDIRPKFSISTDSNQ